MPRKVPRSFLPEARRRRKATLRDPSGLVRSRSRFVYHEEQADWLERLQAKLPPREKGLPISYVLACGFAFLEVGPDMTERLGTYGKPERTPGVFKAPPRDREHS